MPGTGGTSTAHPPSTGISHICTRIPHQEHDAAQQDHHKSRGNDVRAWKHQLKIPPRIQRSSSWGSDRGKLFPVTLPHRYLVCICTLGRADSDRGCSGHSGNVTTHGPLLDSSSRKSLWEEERGATLPAPKKCTQLGRGDAFTAQGQDPGLDAVALIRVGLP